MEMLRPANEYAIPLRMAPGRGTVELCPVAALCLARRPEPRRRVQARVLTESQDKQS